MSKSKRSTTSQTSPTASTENSGRIREFPNLKPFPKGVSGNAGGRPKKLPLSDTIRLELEQESKGKVVTATAIARKLIQMALAGNLDAIREIADRVEGKPRQRTEISGSEGNPISFEVAGTREAVERRLAELLSISRI